MFYIKVTEIHEFVNIARIFAISTMLTKTISDNKRSVSDNALNDDNGKGRLVLSVLNTSILSSFYTLDLDTNAIK